MTNKHFLSISDCAKETGLSEFYLRKGVKDGTVPHITCGAKYMINVALLLKRLDSESEDIAIE